VERVPVAGPWITDKEIEYVTEAVRSAWYGRSNVYHERFEAAFAEYVGRRHALALPSCTSAIHLALACLGIGPGDEVIVPDITWIATSAPITYVGATPVFADIDPETWCISEKSLDACITERTRAVVPVDLYGNMPNWREFLSIARRRGIAVIEDAAQAIGSEYDGRKAGSFGEISVFSFHGTKTLTTGEGGMLVTDDDVLHRRCRFLADHGRDRGERMFWNTEIAYKYKMSAMQAALGLAQLERIDELITRKREIFSWYKARLGGMPDLTLNAEKSMVKNTYWMPTVIMAERLGIRKEYVIEQMKQRWIDCRPFFYPLSSLPAYRQEASAETASDRNEVAYGVSPLGINLPSSLNISEKQVEYACTQFREILSECQP